MLIDKNYKFYSPNIFFKMKYKPTQNDKINKIKNIRNLGILNKFLSGVSIIKINPVTLLIKNRG
mgnify:CR=1 FL=1|jgi:hypothetical protein